MRELFAFVSVALCILAFVSVIAVVVVLCLRWLA